MALIKRLLTTLDFPTEVGQDKISIRATTVRSQHLSLHKDDFKIYSKIQYKQLRIYWISLGLYGGFQRKYKYIFAIRFCFRMHSFYALHSNLVNICRHFTFLKGRYSFYKNCIIRKITTSYGRNAIFHWSHLLKKFVLI